MSFLDLDAGEKLLGKKASDLSAEDLLAYSQVLHKEQFGYPIVFDFIKDRAVMRWLKKMYGEDAGYLIKWVFFKYHGKVGDESFAPNMFNSAHKWWIDQRRAEMKPALVVKMPKKQSNDFMSVDDLFALSRV